jgi:hypothetical protein
MEARKGEHIYEIKKIMNWFRLIKFAQTQPAVTQTPQSALPDKPPYGFWILKDGTCFPVIRHNLAIAYPPPRGLRGVDGVKDEGGAIRAGWIRVMVAGGDKDRLFDGGQKPTTAQVAAMQRILDKYGYQKIGIEFPNTGSKIIEHPNQLSQECCRNFPAKSIGQDFWGQVVQDGPMAVRTRFRTGD